MGGEKENLLGLYVVLLSLVFLVNGIQLVLTVRSLFICVPCNSVQPAVCRTSSSVKNGTDEQQKAFNVRGFWGNYHWSTRLVFLKFHSSPDKNIPSPAYIIMVAFSYFVLSLVLHG